MSGPDDRLRRKRLQLASICLAFTIVSLGMRLVYQARLETTSLMFIGIPALLALLLGLTPEARNPVMAAIKGITIGPLLSAVLFGEGLVCILMAAPLCYLVGIAVGSLVQLNRKKKQPKSALLFAPLLLASMEGATDPLSMPREETVTARRVIAASPADVERALAAAMRLTTPLPSFFRIGFPRPVSARGEGLAVGQTRRIRFAGGEGHPGDLVLEVTARAPGSVTWRAVTDESKIAHWLRWRASTVAWAPAGGGGTEVSWTLSYRRGLDPAAYFAPLERYAVRLAAGYLIDDLATPADTAAR